MPRATSSSMFSMMSGLGSEPEPASKARSRTLSQHTGFPSTFIWKLRSNPSTSSWMSSVWLEIWTNTVK